MADQVVPITDIASAGVIKDMPSISLPPNAYSDVKNIRFHSGAARKMEGEALVSLAGLPNNVVYATYWQAPGGEYYVVVSDNGTTATVRVYDINNSFNLDAMKTMDSGSGAVWQHTLFNGGFNLVLNNGVSTPTYLTYPETGLTGALAPLPNWDSYLSQEEITTVTWDEFNADIMLGRKIDFTTESLLYTVIPRDTSVGVFNFIQETSGGTTPYTLDTTTDVDQDILTPQARSEGVDGALPGDQITISIRTDASITVTAGVIRAYGNLLIAGNLMERDMNNVVVRNIPGTIRTSDVAAPGAIPFNWNPFRNGANTADEFILSSTGKVQDMAELQGVMYVYTDVSIHGIQQTGNETIPFQISTVTDSYGCNSIGGVMEFDGRHLVVGSQDVYVFAGHPGSISSIADGRVRHYLYGTVVDVDSPINTDNIRMVRNQKYDEIWIFTPDGSITEMLVWNYRTQAWTIRDQSAVVSGTQGIDSPLFATATQVFEGDKSYNKLGSPNTYESYVQRMRLGLTPEFDTETLGATAMMYTGFQTGVAPDLNPNLEIRMRGSETPSDNIGLGPFADHKVFEFNGHDDYKVDTRIHGRFINYKISDAFTVAGVVTPTNNLPWNITGYQLEIMKGGKR